MKWFRLYSELLHDPKAQRLSPALFKHWINLLCLANEGTPRGILPPPADIAFALRIKVSEATPILARLEAEGLLDRTETGQLFPHNWPERQRNSDDVAARVRTYRTRQQAQIEGYVTLQETLPQHESNALDTDTEEDIDKNKHTPLVPPPVDAPPPPAVTPAPKPGAGFDFPALWAACTTALGYEPTWNYSVETKAVKRLLGTYPRAAPDELAAFLVYAGTLWPWCNEPDRQVTFSTTATHFGKWYTGGQPASAKESPHGKASHDLAPGGTARTRSDGERLANIVGTYFAPPEGDSGDGDDGPVRAAATAAGGGRVLRYRPSLGPGAGPHSR